MPHPWFNTEQLFNPETLAPLPPPIKPEPILTSIADLLVMDAPESPPTPPPVDLDSDEYTETVARFWAYVRENYPLSEASAKTYRSGLRRIERDFGPLDYYDPVVIDQYRLSMKHGTRSIFDYVWAYWREAELARGGTGWVRVEIPPMSRVRFPHPLCPDLTTLSGTYRLDDLAKLRCRDVRGKVKEAVVESALMRVYEFQRQRAFKTADLDDFLIPSGQRNEGMKPWRMEYIINSESTATDSATERFAGKLASHLTVAGVSGFVLRQYMMALWNARPSLNRSSMQHELFESLRTALVNRQYTTLMRLMGERWSKSSLPPAPLW